MPAFSRLLCWSLLLAAPLNAIAAEPAEELAEVLATLARTSHRWETTARERFRAETQAPRLNPNAPIEVRGQYDPDGFTVLEIAPTRGMPVALHTVARMGDVVAQTPEGWMRRTELRQAFGGKPTLTVDGKSVPTTRYVTALLEATARRPLSEELFDLVADCRSVRREQGLLLGELREDAIERLWGDAQARRAPEVHGTVICKVGRAGLEEVHVVLGIGFPQAQRGAVAWTMQQWSIRIRELGTAEVDPPADAVAALNE